MRAKISLLLVLLLAACQAPAEVVQADPTLPAQEEPLYVVVLRYDRTGHFDPFSGATEEDLATDDYFLTFVYEQFVSDYTIGQVLTNPPQTTSSEYWIYEVSVVDIVTVWNYEWKSQEGRVGVDDLIPSLINGSPYPLAHLDGAYNIVITDYGNVLIFQTFD